MATDAKNTGLMALGAKDRRGLILEILVAFRNLKNFKNLDFFETVWILKESFEISKI